jgi:molybdopterin/thiamine biosynthesis adenylyltransferase
MKKMATSNVLIVGLKGLGVEIGQQLAPTSRGIG